MCIPQSSMIFFPPIVTRIQLRPTSLRLKYVYTWTWLFSSYPHYHIHIQENLKKGPNTEMGLLLWSSHKLATLYQQQKSSNIITRAHQAYSAIRGVTSYGLLWHPCICRNGCLKSKLTNKIKLSKAGSVCSLNITFNYWMLLNNLIITLMLIC